MTNTPDKGDAALDRLAACVKTNPQFSDDDAAVLKDIIEAYRGWRYFGRMSKIIIFTLGAIAGFIAAWDVLVAKLRAMVIG